MATAAPLGGEESERGERAGRQAGWRMEGEEAATGVQGSWGREDVRHMRRRAGKFGLGEMGEERGGWAESGLGVERGGREEEERDQRGGGGRTRELV